MSRHRLSAPLTDASHAIQATLTHVAILSWPADLVDATTPLRQITTATATIANRLHSGARNLMIQVEDNTYPETVGEAAGHLPSLLTVIDEHCRHIDRQWENVGVCLADVLTTDTPKHPVLGLGGVSTAADAMAAAVSASHGHLWPIDCVRAARTAADLAAALAAVSHRLSDALANSGVHHPGVESARGWLNRITQRYNAIKNNWDHAATHLAAIEDVRKSLPRTPSDWPAITL